MTFFAKAYGLKGKDLKEAVKSTLDLVGLLERQNDPIKTFSGGMKRRLNIAVALMHQPEIIIMDEPTVGIDPQSRKYILETVKKLNQDRKMTVIYTSHYMEEVEYLCDRVYIMDCGEVIASGTKDEIKGILSQENTVEVMFDQLSAELITTLKEDASISSVMEDGNKFTVICSAEVNILEKLMDLGKREERKLVSVQVKMPTLEDVFLHLTGKKLRD
ncbi:ABC transporter ATP-binding protein [Evansella tamaricis]|uniref:ABC transporter ATP-binding protein n=1 Tax=Evansella tamaricis TaxID=2069301 RepID=A0ABS6JFA4_9BACI|nr:ABC transporter ATP-binding protein [Evansella tamaricis]MBU9712360.1 ABC transporter ATP-binding protein [Evansella tamaricis]